jgi:diguanylate cyclase (GGDEF)-like protein
MGTSLINVRYSLINTRKKLTELADTEAEFKKEYLQNYISGIEMLLSSILNNDLTFKYMQSGSPDHKWALQNLFYALTFANKEVMQLRYIDAEGKEIIRIDRDRKSPELLIVPENKLQDKSKRYYFKEVSMLNAGQFWHSNVDLNVERGQIEIPIKPTLRVATQLIYKSEYKGILIANLLFEHTIKSLSNSTGFLVYLADKDGEIIHNPDSKMSWSKYLDHKKNLHNLFPRDVGKILTHDTYHSEEVYSYSLGAIFRNKENVKLIMAPRIEYLKELQHKNIFSALFITPEYSSEHKIESYLAVGQEVTSKKQVEQLSITDRLTGLFNRLKLEAVLNGELARFIRYQVPFSVIMLDIDFFKRVNDVHGHPVGDQVLVHLANLLELNIRDTDCISRWGGEEFLIVASNTNQDSAYILAEKLRQVIEAGNFPVVKSVTVSCGVAQYVAGEAVSDLVFRVDKALYRAKDQGRNLVAKA